MTNNALAKLNWEPLSPMGKAIDWDEVLAEIKAKGFPPATSDDLLTLQIPYNEKNPIIYYDKNEFLPHKKSLSKIPVMPLEEYVNGYNNYNDDYIYDILKDKKFDAFYKKKKLSENKIFDYLTVPGHGLPTTRPYDKPKLTAHTELSEVYAKKIAEMDNQVTPTDIANILHYLRLAPLTLAVSTLGAILADKSKHVSQDVRSRLDSLLVFAYDIQTNGRDVAKVLNSQTSPASIQIFNPKTDDETDLNEMLIKAQACTKRHRNITTMATQNDLEGSPAHYLSMDAKAGGSIHFLANGENASAYNRLYLIVTKHNKVALFHDCIEAQDISGYRVSDYVRSKAEVLTSSLATSIILAQRLGIESVVLGENEVLEMARDLGFGERSVFDKKSDRVSQKLGYICSCGYERGPAAWRLSSGDEFRTMPVDLFTQKTYDNLSAQAKLVEQRFAKNQNNDDYRLYRKLFERLMSLVPATCS